MWFATWDQDQRRTALSILQVTKTLVATQYAYGVNPTICIHLKHACDDIVGLDKSGNWIATLTEYVKYAARLNGGDTTKTHYFSNDRQGTMLRLDTLNMLISILHQWDLKYCEAPTAEPL